MDTSKGTERINEEGAVEINVDAVDYRTPAGRDQPEKERVEVTHLVSKDEPPGTANVVTEAAGKVAEKLQSAKQAITGDKGGDKKKEQC